MTQKKVPAATSFVSRFKDFRKTRNEVKAELFTGPTGSKSAREKSAIAHHFHKSAPEPKPRSAGTKPAIDLGRVRAEAAKNKAKLEKS